MGVKTHLHTIIRFGLSRHLALGQLQIVPNSSTNASPLNRNMPILAHPVSMNHKIKQKILIRHKFPCHSRIPNILLVIVSWPVIVLQEYDFLSCESSHSSIMIRWMCVHFPGGLRHTM